MMLQRALHVLQWFVSAIALLATIAYLRPWVSEPVYRTVPAFRDGQSRLTRADEAIINNHRQVTASPALLEAIVRPSEEVNIGHGFWIDRCEVKAGEYKQFRERYIQHGKHRFCREAGCTRLHYSADETHEVRSLPEQPASAVTFYDAYAFCRAAGGRLPSRVEWNAAAAGKEGRVYPWGNEPNGQPWRYVTATQPWASHCGMFPATDTPSGVSDMGNNLSEWVMPDEPNAVPMEMGGNYMRLGWDLYSLAYLARPTKAESLKPSVGFRCVYDTDPAGERYVENVQPSLITDLDDARSFEAQVLDESMRRAVVVDFWEPWCIPCRQLSPRLERLARAASGSWLLVRVNTSLHRGIGTDFSIDALPTLKVFRDRREVATKLEMFEEEELRQWMVRWADHPTATSGSHAHPMPQPSDAFIWRRQLDALHVDAGVYPIGPPKASRVPVLLRVSRVSDAVQYASARTECCKQGIDIATTEVTVEQYRRFLWDPLARLHLYSRRGEPVGHDYQPDRWSEQQQHPDWPVTGVSFWDASAYATWAGGRLPEADEWTAIGAGKAGRLYPWGDTFEVQIANTVDESPKPQARSVGKGSRDATPEGVLDLGGNVSEWTQTTTAVERGTIRVDVAAVKGGNYLTHGATGSLNANEVLVPLDQRQSSIGFRLSRSH
jgi:formylglycine-generating enzyme required for sulfatase activity/thiol-disulfide isomerase/thioredoxin